MEIGTEVNVIPLKTNLSCYNTVDKATSILPKNIEPDIINYLPLYQIQAPEKVQTSPKVKNNVESASWKTL